MLNYIYFLIYFSGSSEAFLNAIEALRMLCRTQSFPAHFSYKTADFSREVFIFFVRNLSAHTFTDELRSAYSFTSYPTYGLERVGISKEGSPSHEAHISQSSGSSASRYWLSMP